MKNLKLLYLLTLCALCLYVATGPAQAGAVVIRNLGVGVVAPVQGNLNWVSGPGWASPGYGATVSLGMEAQCVREVACVDTVDFSFLVDDGGVFHTPITISLSGTSTDDTATGTVAFYDSQPGGETIQNWTTSGVFLLMTPFTVETTGLSFGRYQGEFTFRLAPGGDLNVPLATSLDFTSVPPPTDSTPEPGSALLLGAGIACVGFLRYKVHG